MEEMNTSPESPPSSKRVFSRDITTYARKRSLAACELCRLKKKKCDNRIPTCSSCEKIGAKCVVRSLKNDAVASNVRDYSSFDPASLEILSKVDRLSTQLQDINTKIIQPNFEANSKTILKDANNQLWKSKMSDEILNWKCFKGKYTHLIGKYREARANLKRLSDFNLNSIYLANFKFEEPINSNQVYYLVENFIANVHTKNPMLYVDQLRLDTQEVIDNGIFRRDEKSCLVAIVCALGAVAKPIVDSKTSNCPNSTIELASSLETTVKYFAIATNIKGFLNFYSIVTSQCYVLFGIFYMYIMDPINGWYSFNQASSAFTLFTTNQFHTYEEHEVPSIQLQERLYWTCLRSQEELREKHPFPESCLVNLNYPYSIPTPPNQQIDSMSDPSSKDIITKSWFYYLTEIGLRNIFDEVNGDFYANNSDWDACTTEEMLNMIQDYESRINVIYTNVEPTIMEASGNPDNPVEVIEFLKTRFSWLKLLLFRPLMYRASHYNDFENGTMLSKISKFYREAWDLLTRIPYKHRHHGMWLSLREQYNLCLILLGLYIKKGDLYLNFNDLETYVQYYIKKVSYWMLEAPDLSESTKIITVILNDLKLGRRLSN